jgi:indolepyruvate ferredoxin oxidoreductase alpha subunit
VEKCVHCGYCLKLGCGAIQVVDGQEYIDPALCAGDICGVCEQLCPQEAISI